MEKALLVFVFIAVNVLFYRRMESGEYGELPPKIKKIGMGLTFLVSVAFVTPYLLGYKENVLLSWLFVAAPFIAPGAFLLLIYKFKPGNRVKAKYPVLVVFVFWILLVLLSPLFLAGCASLPDEKKAKEVNEQIFKDTAPKTNPLQPPPQGTGMQHYGDWDGDKK